MQSGHALSRVTRPPYAGRYDFQNRRNRKVIFVARIDESDEEEIMLDGANEYAPADNAIVGGNEVARPVE